MSQKKTKIINGVRYYKDRPNNCRNCYFWKNKKTGCMLGEENCYYLAEIVKTAQETKCDGCPYARAKPCVSVSCYKDLTAWLALKRKEREGKSHAGTV